MQKGAIPRANHNFALVSPRDGDGDTHIIGKVLQIQHKKRYAQSNLPLGLASWAHLICITTEFQPSRRLKKLVVGRQRDYFDFKLA
jgi:hypothetical protein